MSTTAQMKALAKPLLARNPDLVMIGRDIFLAPIRHVARFICLDNTSGKDGFSPRAGALHLFEHRSFLGLTHTQTMGGPGQGLWLLSQPDIQSRFLDTCERDVLPSLRAMETISDFAAFSGEANFPHQPMDFYALRQVPIDVALGNFDAARAICKALASGKSMWSDSDFEEERTRILTELCPPLQTEDRAALAAVLHRWEAHSVKALKLEKYWEPTPFPIEQM
jgi:hypothetical protein